MVSPVNPRTGMRAPADARGLDTMSAGVSKSSAYYRWIYRRIRPWLGRSVLEVGPGYGTIAAMVAADGRGYVGVDLDEGVIARLAEQAPPGTRFVAGDITRPDVQAGLREERFDTVVSFNVLEHLEDAGPLIGALARVAPGASLVVFVPAMPAIYGTLDREAGHFRRYRKDELHGLLSAHADVHELGYFNGVGAVAWFVAGRVLRLPLNGEATDGAIGLYDKLVVPVARLTDPLTTRIMGQSLLCHARFR
jgi:SAM-dependent methyltransferase